MLTLENYQLWAAEPLHGGLSAQEAAVKWHQLVEEPGAFINYDGISRQGEVGLKQVRVKDLQHVRFQNMYDKSKIIRKKDVKKKACASDVEKAEKGLREGHDSILGSESDLVTIARGMVGEGASSAAADHFLHTFAGKVQRLGDVSSLLPGEEDKGSVKGEQESAASSVGDSGEGSQGGGGGSICGWWPPTQAHQAQVVRCAPLCCSSTHTNILG